MNLVYKSFRSSAFIVLASLLFCSFITLPSVGFAAEATLSSFEKNQPYFVGELGSAWEFPSDHLPVGITLGSFHIAFWNNLNKDYLGHIEANTQGLRDSSILRDNVQIDADSPLTLRELTIADIIIEMINHPTHPRSLVALQETNADLQNFLREQLPLDWKIATPLNQPISQDLFLYDSAVFNLIAIDSVLYEKTAPKSIFTLTLEEKATGKIFRFLQSHVPGGPVKSKEGCEKFSAEALRQFDSNLTIVLMGDMNQSPNVIHNSLATASKDAGLPNSPYTYLSIDYPSHMNTHTQASWIDHFFIYSADSDLDIKGSDYPEEVSSQLVPLVELLNSLKVIVHSSPTAETNAAIANLLPETELEQQIINDPEWIQGASWGEPRPGHPEGAVIFHILEVLNNVETLYGDSPLRENLRVLTLIHDTFKNKVDRNFPAKGENQHGMIARRFAEQFIGDPAILNILQWHDDAYSAWKKGANEGDWEAAYDSALALINALGPNLDLYVAFYTCDNTTGDKTQEPLEWFINIVER